jgi:glycosyltransferase involved in cell wall biosynthesis
MTVAYKAMPKSLHARDKLRWWTRNRNFIAQLERYFDGARPDLAITYLPTANTPALVASAGRPVRMIVTNHNVPREDYQNPGRWGGGDYDRALRLRALDRADRIHVLFPSFGAWFPEHLQDRIVAIPNHVPADPGNHLETPETRDQSILAVGRLAAVKNYLDLVEAWARLGDARGDWQVKVFGGGGPEEKKLRRRISELHLDDSFRLMGSTNRITQEYRKAAIMCHPAEFEGFGLAPAEALASGLPVVAYTDTPGLKEFLQDGRNALLADRRGDRVDHLAKALLKLMQDEPLRHRLGQAGPASVARFSRATYVNHWLRMIESVFEDEMS